METSKFVIFGIKGEEYALHIDQVDLIDKLGQFVKKSGLPEAVLAIEEIRGQKMPIIDVRFLFHGEKQEMLETSRVIILKTDDLSYALLVEEVKELLDLNKDQLHHVGLVFNSNNSYFTQVANADERLITIVDGHRLIQSIGGIEEIVSQSVADEPVVNEV